MNTLVQRILALLFLCVVCTIAVQEAEFYCQSDYFYLTEPWEFIPCFIDLPDVSDLQYFEAHAINTRTGGYIGQTNGAYFPSGTKTHWNVTFVAEKSTFLPNDTYIATMRAYNKTSPFSQIYYAETSFILSYYVPPPDVTPPVLDHFSLPLFYNPRYSGFVGDRYVEAFVHATDDRALDRVEVYAEGDIPFALSYALAFEMENGNALVPLFLQNFHYPSGTYCFRAVVVDVAGNRVTYTSANFSGLCTEFIYSTCSPGYYAPETNLSDCQPCPTGTYVDSPGAISCDTCRPGSAPACGGAATTCALCPAGTYGPSGIACIECTPGYYQFSMGNRHCGNCNPGEYSSTSGALYCDICPAGTYSYGETAECTQCPAGTYSGSHAVNCIPCPEGQTSEVGSAECVDIE